MCLAILVSPSPATFQQGRGLFQRMHSLIQQLYPPLMLLPEFYRPEEFFQPPAVPGYGAAGGFELRLLDKAGSGDYKKMETVSNDFVKELNKRPELASVFTFYSASFPQYMLRIDNDIAQQKINKILF